MNMIIIYTKNSVANNLISFDLNFNVANVNELFDFIIF